MLHATCENATAPQLCRISPRGSSLSLGASVGLAAAYVLSYQLGWDQEFLSWTLAIVGFAIGVPFDYRELQVGVSPSTIPVLGYLGFAAFLMAVEVLLVLTYLPVSA